MKLKTSSSSGWLAAVAFGLWAFFVGCWLVNGYKLTQVDFEAPYKGEIVHAIGLAGPLAAFTVWNDDK